MPNYRVNLNVSTRATGHGQLKTLSASSPSLSAMKSPVAAVFSQPKRTFAVQACACGLNWASDWMKTRGVNE